MPVTAMTGAAWTIEEIQTAGSTLRLRKGGAGDPLLVLPHDIGSLDRLPFLRCPGAAVHRLPAVASGLRRLRAPELDAQRPGRGGHLSGAPRDD